MCGTYLILDVIETKNFSKKNLKKKKRFKCKNVFNMEPWSLSFTKIYVHNFLYVVFILIFLVMPI